jgi:hypothetical protein
MKTLLKWILGEVVVKSVRADTGGYDVSSPAAGLNVSQPGTLTFCS